MRIGILSATYPPDRCGVGDYCMRLAEALVGEGHRVTIWTRQVNPERRDGIHFRQWPKDWTGEQDHLRQVDKLLVQYTPQLVFHPPWIVGIDFLRTLRLLSRRIPTAVLAHEVRYPFGWNRNGLLYGVPHFAHFLGVIKFSKHVFFSTETMAEEWMERIPAFSNRFSWNPVGANILPSTNYVQADSEENVGWKLVHFGGHHPTHLLEYVVSAGLALQETFPQKKIRLVFVGLKGEHLPEGWQGSGLTVEATGYASAEKVSEILGSATALLAPLMDGISTRRGSVMSALAHRIPVLTTRNWSTGNSVPWEKFLSVSETSNDAFSKLAVSFFRRSALDRRIVADAGFKYYQEHFAWDAIARGLISKLDSL